MEGKGDQLEPRSVATPQSSYRTVRQNATGVRPPLFSPTPCVVAKVTWVAGWWWGVLRQVLCMVSCLQDVLGRTPGWIGSRWLRSQAFYAGPLSQSTIFTVMTPRACGFEEVLATHLCCAFVMLVSGFSCKPNCRVRLQYRIVPRDGGVPKALEFPLLEFHGNTIQ